MIPTRVAIVGAVVIAVSFFDPALGQAISLECLPDAVRNSPSRDQYLYTLIVDTTARTVTVSTISGMKSYAISSMSDLEVKWQVPGAGGTKIDEVLNRETGQLWSFYHDGVMDNRPTLVACQVGRWGRKF